ncbi:MAG: DUF695 domain-containing protein [Clostridiales bacterium]|nr:DUF695 domain-containing protein [Clostridiales bacterium]
MPKKTTWLEYDWELDGADAKFGVELSYYRSAPDEKYPLLLYFCCQRKDDKELAPSDTARIEALARKCVKRTGIRPAGFVQTKLLRQYYFYCEDKAAHDKINLIASKEKKLLCRVGGKREEDWATYFQLLYPDEVKYQTVKNREQTAKMRKMGDNLESARRINLHVCFRTEQDRLMFEVSARQSGFAIGSPEFISESDYPNGVVIYRISPLTRADIDALTVRVIRLAQKLDGKLLYWDCNIVPKSVSRRY